MKIYYDNIIFSLQKSGGISIYFYEIFKKFQNNNLNFKVLDSIKKENENIFYRNLSLRKNLVKEKNYISNKILRYLDVKINEKEKFIFHSSYYRICSSKNAINVTTVHDFTYEKYFKGIKKIIHSYQKRRAILKSDLIICISKNTKKDLLYFIPEAKNKNIEVIYNGVSDEFYKKEKIENKFDKKYSSEKYILYVGARKGYKKFNLALEVMSKLKKDFKLIFVGGEKLENDEKQKIVKLLGQNYEHLVGISIEDLNSLYNYAFCLIYPSEYEGFGIPIIEAMKAGCPVLAYSNSSIPEVAGPSLLVKENNVSNYLRNIEKLFDKKNRDEIIEIGIEFSQKFSWNKTYKQLLKRLEDIQ
ncbi:MAG: glycosyltransferase family 4 protein [Fusobacteriaceae bacterium]